MTIWKISVLLTALPDLMSPYKRHIFTFLSLSFLVRNMRAFAFTSKFLFYDSLKCCSECNKLPNIGLCTLLN